MNEIQRYLAEEIALDCNAGHITRPEAQRRLHLMGLSAAMVAALLTACGSDGSSADNANANANASMATQGSEMPAATNPSDNMMASNGGSMTTPPTPPSQNPASSETNVTPLTTGMQPGGMAPPGMEPAAMNPDDDTPPADQGTPGATVASALPTEAITFGPNGTLQGALAVPATTPRGAVLVIHENRGLNDHTRTVAGRLAAAGYVAIALDLLSEEGGTASLGEEANATTALGAASMANPMRFLTDMRAALDELERRAPGAKLGAIGFCFGGGQMWQLLAADARLSAVTPFYGQLPAGADFSASNAAVLAFYGELDARINMTRDAADSALAAAGLIHEMVTEPGANHAFFNDTRPSYNAAAAADAWVRLIAFFRENLG